MMVDAYIEAALWASMHFEDENDSSGTPFDEVDAELSAEFVRKARRDCAAFCREAAPLLKKKNIDPGMAGHDFWLTRNRHGAGFWDRGYGKVGDRLTDICETFGTVDPYLGDDGLIYLS
jgi:hypothetical protein